MKPFLTLLIATQFLISCNQRHKKIKEEDKKIVTKYGDTLTEAENEKFNSFEDNLEQVPGLPYVGTKYGSLGSGVNYRLEITRNGTAIIEFSGLFDSEILYEGKFNQDSIIAKDHSIFKIRKDFFVEGGDTIPLHDSN